MQNYHNVNNPMPPQNAHFEGQNFQHTNDPNKKYKIKPVEESVHWMNSEIRKIRELLERFLANR